MDKKEYSWPLVFFTNNNRNFLPVISNPNLLQAA